MTPEPKGENVRLVTLRTAVRQEMEKRGMTQVHLVSIMRAEGGYIKKQTLSDILNGKTMPSRVHVEHICSALEIDVNTIAEFALEAARDQIDPKVVGSVRAMANYHRLNLAKQLPAKNSDLAMVG